MAVNLWRQSVKDSAVGPIRSSLGQRPRSPVSTSFQGLKARSIGRDLEISPDRSRLPVAPRLSGPESGALSTMSQSWGLRPEGGCPEWRRCQRSGQCRNRRRSLGGSPGSAVPGDRGRRPAEPFSPLASTCGKSMDWLARGWGTWACRKFRGRMSFSWAGFHSGGWKDHPRGDTEDPVGGFFHFCHIKVIRSSGKGPLTSEILESNCTD